MPFYAAMPSVDGVRWYTCELHSRDRPVFCGSKEDAEEVALALNKREQARYEQASSDFHADRLKQEAERSRADWNARMEAWIADMANTVCLSALSLPG